MQTNVTIPLKEGWKFIKGDDPAAAGALDQASMAYFSFVLLAVKVYNGR